MAAKTEGGWWRRVLRSRWRAPRRVIRPKRCGRYLEARACRPVRRRIRTELRTMSKYDIQPIDFTGLKTIPIAERGGKVRIEDFGAPYVKAAGVRGWLNSLPKILAADAFRSVVEALRQARDRRKPILWGLGGHVIKCGLAPVLTDLMERGYASAFSMNGSAAIHDFEIAIAGQTSEDVESVLPDGRFGTAEETGREMNEAIACGDRDGI